ncbi:hypothetical protein E4582_00445 [Luteimonas yindakuii]|uniref:C-type lysozyme inhibitor domain-containing protein n=1 Tax=Luteimonas yindakuii TaxID=2565782 RepID=A0A4Z1RFD4_9GAMM|nr:hypothetical protein [Luteimonas yindakuii]QCO67203.1 hypothetical protein E5843_04345 [Luteimonas yindakuii]TKS53387.1 hypothetical protein E4582_00445 [Luteimonas yindakuii]
MRTASVITACLLLAACGQDSQPTPATPVSEAFEQQGAKPPVGPVDATYLCDGGNRVDLIENRRFARIAMSDGRVVQLGSMDKSQPPTWSDVGLRFVVGADYVELSQDNGRTLRCEEQASTAAVEAESATG